VVAARRLRPAPPRPAPAESGPSRKALLLGFGVAALLLLVSSAVVLALAFGGRGKRDARADAATTHDDRPSRPADVTPDDENDNDKGNQRPRRDPLDAPPPPTTLSAEEQQEVNQAIDRGADFLKKHPPPRLDPHDGGHTWGVLPLVALTLLECGVPKDDPAVERLSNIIHDDAPNLDQTYSLSLAILFLDRLGDPKDDKLLRLLGARLMAGQTASGGWWYICPALPEDEAEKFLTYLDTNPLAGLSAAGGGDGGARIIRPGQGGDASRAGGGGADGGLSRDGLPASVKDSAVVTFDPRRKPLPHDNSDNSNTQFAILGVWTARRHGVPAERSLAMIAQRFRQSQNGDGSWGYSMGGSERPDSMTCAGLLGLAVSRASDESREAADKDPAIAKGLQFLGQKVGEPRGKPPRNPQPGAPLVGANSLGDLYWMWSLERVGVIYSLPTLGGKDWYAWGAQLLLAHQADDGSWFAAGGLGIQPHVDTCFALLFLKRVNVAKDLTHQLQMIGPVRDPDAARAEK
jgi:hypothetical protein